MAGSIADGEAELQHTQALQAAITAALELPGLLGGDVASATGYVAAPKQGSPAWRQAAVLRAQLGQTEAAKPGLEHLDCVRMLLQHYAGLHKSQLDQVLDACAALKATEVRPCPCPCSQQ